MGRPIISRRGFLTVAAASIAGTRLAMAQASDGVPVIRAMKLEGQVLDEGQPKTALWSYGPA